MRGETDLRGNTKGYSSTYLAMGFANVRAGTNTKGYSSKFASLWDSLMFGRVPIQKGTRALISLWDSLMFGRVRMRRQTHPEGVVRLREVVHVSELRAHVQQPQGVQEHRDRSIAGRARGGARAEEERCNWPKAGLEPIVAAGGERGRALRCSFKLCTRAARRVASSSAAAGYSQGRSSAGRGRGRHARSIVWRRLQFPKVAMDLRGFCDPVKSALRRALFV